MGTDFPLTFINVSHADDFSKYNTAKNNPGFRRECCA